MKKLMIFIFSIGVVTAVSAQKVAVGIGGHYGGFYRPHTTVVVGYTPYYRPYYWDPYYRPYYGYRYHYRPTKLDLQIADIKNDYEEKISAARHDKSVPGKERRANIRELKHDEQQAITDAQSAYYKN